MITRGREPYIAPHLRKTGAQTHPAGVDQVTISLTVPRRAHLVATRGGYAGGSSHAVSPVFVSNQYGCSPLFVLFHAAVALLRFRAASTPLGEVVTVTAPCDWTVTTSAGFFRALDGAADCARLT